MFRSGVGQRPSGAWIEQSIRFALSEGASGQRWRLAVAARLLRNERSSIIRVAQAVGYESEASFSRAFKTEYGVAPGLWRSAAVSRRSPAPRAGT